jgi:pimeloyl-ACP methyl ester carboxylesterase
MPYAAVNDLTMYYEEHGVPGGGPLVLLHGFTATGDFWRAQIEPFGAHYRLIVPDWRGHGRTNNPGGLARMNHRQFARDAIALCGELGLVRPIFCGESSGAMQLLTLALEAPDLARALVLTGCAHVYADELRAWWREQTPESVVAPERRPAMQKSHTALGADHWRTVAAAWIALGEHGHPHPNADRPWRSRPLLPRSGAARAVPPGAGCRAVHPSPNRPRPANRAPGVVQRDRARLPGATGHVRRTLCRITR